MPESTVRGRSIFKIKVTMNDISGRSNKPSDKEWSSLGEDDGSVFFGKTGLPGNFQDPDEFRRKLEQSTRAMPRLSLPAPLVYAVLISGIVYWCYFGYKYSQTHFPVSNGQIVLFFAVFLTSFLALLKFLELSRNVRIAPILERLAKARPGAFLVVQGASPVLFYAEERWIGRVDFCTGGEGGDTSTRLDARLREPAGRIDIRQRKWLDKVFHGPDKFVVTLPNSEFSRTFAVASPEAESAKEFLSPSVMSAMMQLGNMKRATAHVNRGRVRVEVDLDLAEPRRSTQLETFLVNAETIIRTAAGEDLPSSQAFSRTASVLRMGIFAKILYGGLIIAFVITVGLWTGEWVFHRQFVQRAREIQGLATGPEGNVITEQDLARVPVPVQNYLRFSGVVGRKPIRSVHIRGKGSLLGSKTKKWSSFHAEFFMTTAKPSVCAYSRMRLLSVLHVAAFETWFNEESRRIVKFLSMFPRREMSGDDLTQALLVRFITDMPVCPTAFLDESSVTWVGSDMSSADMVFHDGGQRLTATFFFNPDGSIARVEFIREMGKRGNCSLEKWTGSYLEYKEIDGFKLPTRFEDTWNLKKGDVTFKTFTADDISLK